MTQQISDRKPPHGNQRYPWDVWMDGQQHNATHGKHFDCSPENFRSLLFQRATKSGRKVWTRVQGQTVVFCFYADDTE